MRRQAQTQDRKVPTPSLDPPPPPVSDRAVFLRNLALWEFNRSEETLYIGDHFAEAYGPSFNDCKYIRTCDNKGCHVRGIPAKDFTAFTNDLHATEIYSSKPMPNYGDLMLRQVFHRWYCRYCFPSKLQNLLEFLECCEGPCGQPEEEEEESPLSGYAYLQDDPPTVRMKSPSLLRLDGNHIIIRGGQVDMI